MLNEFGFTGDFNNSVANRYKRAFLVKHIMNSQEPNKSSFVKIQGNTLYFVNQEYSTREPIVLNSLTDRYGTQSVTKFLDQQVKTHCKTQSEVQSRLLISPCILNSPKNQQSSRQIQFSKRLIKPQFSLPKQIQSLHTKTYSQKSLNSTKSKTQIQQIVFKKPQTRENNQQRKSQLIRSGMPKIMEKFNKIKQSNGIEGFEQKYNDEWTNDLYDYIQRKQHF